MKVNCEYSLYSFTKYIRCFHKTKQVKQQIWIEKQYTLMHMYIFGRLQVYYVLI